MRKLVNYTAVLVPLLVAAAGCTQDALPLGPHAVVGAEAAPGLMLPSTIQDLLALEAGPVAIAHRGMGTNLGEDATRPIENTLAAVRAGFAAGASVVEVDLATTADGKVVAWHEDFLPDRTCFNTLTRDELTARAPHIPSFESVLQTARRVNRSNPDRLAGLLTVDIKPPSPLCDPSDTGEAGIIDAVVAVVRNMNATDLIYFNSMSPVMLSLAAQRAPEIPRQLTLIVLQFLSPEQIEAALGLPVVPISKAPQFGLQWAEVGHLHRLPGYTSPQQAIGIAHAVGAQMISYDLRLLGQMEQMQPGSAAQLVGATKATGLHAFGGDVAEPQHWLFGAAIGLDALYADAVELAVGMQGELE